VHPLNDAQRHRVGIIETAGAHLLALIEDTLDLASIEAGTLPLESEPVPLAPLLADALQWAQPAAARAGVSMAVHSLDAVALGDARRLRQVFINLLSNAIKYNRPGGSVVVQLLPTADVAWLAVEVKDTGRGLTRAQMSGLFEPFNRLGAEHGEIEGTGIGLTIVHHLVERMGGAIVVDSEPDIGSCFTVWLPAVAGAPAGVAQADEGRPVAAPARNGQPLPVAAGTNAGKILDVLYIEDNAVNVLLVEELVALRPAWKLHVAETGEDGVRKALDLRPRVVLVDMQLPDFDGYEVLRRLRGQAPMQGSRFIALSANAMPEDIAVAREAGFDDYWTKPIDFAQFLGGLDSLAG
jgi:CheY-like chemotaxis protein